MSFEKSAQPSASVGLVVAIICAEVLLFGGQAIEEKNIANDFIARYTDYGKCLHASPYDGGKVNVTGVWAPGETTITVDPDYEHTARPMGSLVFTIDGYGAIVAETDSTQNLLDAQNCPVFV
ncbi:MAG TPA: hypothetical protein VF809_03215 [Candidatus Saccharimonadales bacterium]